MLNRLQFRLFLSHLIAVGLTLAIIVGALVILILATPISTVQTYRHISDVARASFAYLGNGGALDIDTRLQDVALTNEIRTLRLSADGRTRFDSAGEFAPGDSVAVRVNRELQPGSAALVRGTFSDKQGQEWLTVSVAREAVGTVVFAAPRPRNRLAAALSETLVVPLGQAGLIGLALSIVLASILSAWISRPLGQTAAAARAITAGDYDRRAPEQGPAEVRDLARQFNRMAGQVQQTRQTQRDFLANVTHELKTPLTSIQGFAQAIVDGAAARPDEASQVIFDEAGRMLRLVEDLLDLAKIESGQASMKHDRVDLAELLAHVMERFAPRAAEQRISLSTAGATLPAVMGDADRLVQIFTNLLDNALNHTPSGGQITIQTQLGPANVEIAINDTGDGIPEEDLSRVFERFYQADKSRARSTARGTGLGLTISLEAVRVMGGSIRAESQPGHGARFVVTIPLPEPEQPSGRHRIS